MKLVSLLLYTGTFNISDIMNIVCKVSIQILVNELLTFIRFYTLFDIQNSHFETVLQSVLQYEDDPPPFLILLALHQINSESQNYSIMDFMVGW
jgi:hypothetical protein